MRILALCALLVSTLWAPALAQAPAGAALAPVSESDADGPREWEVGASIFGFANGNFIQKPKGDDKDEPYPGFAGFGGGGGVGFAAMWRGTVGLELQIIGSKEPAEGALNFDFGAVTLQLDQTSWHVPLTLKVAAPTKSVRPFLFVGPDFVFPEASGTSDPANVRIIQEGPGQGTNPLNDGPTAELKLGAHAENYTAWTFGFGFEFLLDLNGQDIRIPLVFRGSYNPDLPVKASERSRVTATAKEYLSEWEWQAFVSLGVAYYFL